MNVAITGADGFLATHARFFLHEKERDGAVSVTLMGRKQFGDPDALDAALREADVLLHFAGVNRGSDEELEAGNVALAETIRDSLQRTGTKPHVLFSSSIHEERDTPYGRGKRKAGDLLLAFGKESGCPVTVFALPNLFGEFGKPHYNSAVATFCDDLAGGRESRVDEEGATELLYVRDAVVAMWDAYEGGVTGRARVPGERWRIPDLYATLAEFNRMYRTGAFPDVRDRLELHLFNTLHSYLFERLFPLALSPREDERGTLFEIARSGRADQTFFSSTKPGKTRGQHYHTRKMERFCVVSGEGEIAIRRLLSDEVHVFKVSGAAPVAIDMPTYHAHSLTNTGAEVLLAVFWISEQLRTDDPDTYPEPV